IERAVDQLLTKGYVGRGYLGAGLQRVRLAGRAGAAKGAEGEHGILVVSIDPDGPAAQAGLMVGDIVTAWNAQPVARGGDVVRRLGPDSIGRTVDLQLVRGGTPIAIKMVLGERPLA